VNNLFVLEAPNHLNDGIYLANMAQEFITQPCPLTRSFDNTRNIHQPHSRRHDPFRHNVLTDPREPIIRYAHHSLIGFDGAERIVGGLCRLGTSHCVEQRTFADIW
jgi:hypothetical protein